MPALRNLEYVVSSIWVDESNQRQRVRRLLYFCGWQLWKRSQRKPVVIELFNGLRFIAYPDCSVSSGLIYHRIPDYREITFLREHVAGGTLLDIGANVGSVTLLLADRMDHALLFEPNPRAAERARVNLRLNHLPFEVHELALSDHCGELEFEDSGGVDTCNRTVVGFQSTVPTRRVRGLTLDQFLREYQVPPPVSLIKIDVEGHENAVLRGMREFLAGERPGLIMFEYLERTNLTETLSILQGVGYSVFELARAGPSLVRQTATPLQNLFACPDETVSRFSLKDQHVQKISAIGNHAEFHERPVAENCTNESILGANCDQKDTGVER